MAVAREMNLQPFRTEGLAVGLGRHNSVPSIRMSSVLVLSAFTFLTLTLARMPERMTISMSCPSGFLEYNQHSSEAGPIERYSSPSGPVTAFLSIPIFSWNTGCPISNEEAGGVVGLACTLLFGFLPNQPMAIPPVRTAATTRHRLPSVNADLLMLRSAMRRDLGIVEDHTQ